MAISVIPSASSGGVAPKYQKFTSSGTFTLPTGYGAAKPLLVNIQVIGGGGGGAYAGTGTWTANYNFGSNFFGGTSTGTWSAVSADFSAMTVGGGASGGIASTQMYLTSNLTITVGAAGTRGSTPIPAGTYSYPNKYQFPGNTNANWDLSEGWTLQSSAQGGTGGTSTAGSVSASGGGPANVSYSYNVNYNSGGVTNFNSANANRNANATAGQPAGTANDSSPLIGAIAGGSSTTSAIYGATGVGGKKGDGTTSTGVEGTGGGTYSVGASGAVILTWWE